MAFGEPCERCHLQQSAHDVAYEIKNHPVNASAYLKCGKTRAEALAQQFPDGHYPCDTYESAITHEPWCAGYREINGIEHMCYESGGCQALSEMQSNV